MARTMAPCRRPARSIAVSERPRRVKATRCIPWSGGWTTVRRQGGASGWRVVEERAVKQRFCEALLAKYGKPDTTRPKGFFPRLDMITVYAISVQRMTGKEMALPPLSEQWPAKDRTKMPNAALSERLHGVSRNPIVTRRHDDLAGSD
jgi:hypothetical protein